MPQPRPGEGYESVDQILRDILRSAIDVTGSEQAFILVSRDSTILEVVCARGIRPREVIDAVLNRAASAVHMALRERTLVFADHSGRTVPVLDGFFEINDAAVLGLPLDLGLRSSGTLCLIRRRGARRVSDLDLEIVQALAEQAALAIGAASHQTALTRLADSLGGLAPALA
ncbi:MAG TPA: GAF domain-containing protein [Solimonas sp.]|nr:GAF domain-containing protein [Solimonas sp.]